MALSKGGHYFASAHVNVAYFTVNHKMLLGTAMEAANSTRIALEPEMHTKAPEGVPPFPPPAGIFSAPSVVPEY